MDDEAGEEPAVQHDSSETQWSVFMVSLSIFTGLNGISEWDQVLPIFRSVLLISNYVPSVTQKAWAQGHNVLKHNVPNIYSDDRVPT